MQSVLVTIGFIAVLAVLGWVAFRMEPHWVSKDGQRLIARVCELQTDGRTGRWREARISITADRVLEISPRGLLGANLRGRWTVIGRTANPPARLQIFLLSGEPDLLLRVPASSRAVAHLDEIAEQSAG